MACARRTSSTLHSLRPTYFTLPSSTSSYVRSVVSVRSSKTTRVTLCRADQPKPSA
jgi:hypothetical protein